MAILMSLFCRRLKLYMTSVDDHCVIAIARGCSQLQYLNLGSCHYISNYDEVSTMCQDASFQHVQSVHNVLYAHESMEQVTSHTKRCLLAQFIVANVLCLCTFLVAPKIHPPSSKFDFGSNWCLSSSK